MCPELVSRTPLGTTVPFLYASTHNTEYNGTLRLLHTLCISHFTKRHDFPCRLAARTIGGAGGQSVPLVVIFPYTVAPAE